MGLDVSHDCWHGAYSAFTRFRNMLAVEAGYKLTKSSFGYEHIEYPWDTVTDAQIDGEWENPPDDPLLLLLIHSDCEGVIKAAHAEHLATRLEQLAPALATEGAGHLYNPQLQALQFARGLRAAAAAGEDVEFY